MGKTVRIIIPGVLLLAALIIILLGVIPRSFQETLTATKVDADGNPISNLEICISGRKTVFFGNQRLRKLSIEGLENGLVLSDIDLSKSTQQLGEDYFTLTYGLIVVDPESADIQNADIYTSQAYTISIHYSPDLSYWYICIHSGKEPRVQYFAASNEDSTLAELMEYFICP